MKSQPRKVEATNKFSPISPTAALAKPETPQSESRIDCSSLTAAAVDHHGPRDSRRTGRGRTHAAAAGADERKGDRGAADAERR